MRVEIIAVPFDSGLRDTRMGRGPARLIELGIAPRLQSTGVDVDVRYLEPSPDVFPSEIALAFELQRVVSAAVSSACERDSFPLVLSGNCNVAAGVVGGLRAARGTVPSVCWFDAHADFNTPESTIGGFLDGMAVSMLTGHCWRELTSRVPGFAPVPESRVLMIGVHDIDPLERDLLAASDIRVDPRSASIDVHVRSMLASAGAPDLYLHLDLDSLDSSEGRANGYAQSGGLTRLELLASIDAIGSRGDVRAASITAYDPECDTDDRIGLVAVEAATRIVSSARRAG